MEPRSVILLFFSISFIWIIPGTCLHLLDNEPTPQPSSKQFWNHHSDFFFFLLRRLITVTVTAAFAVNLSFPFQLQRAVAFQLAAEERHRRKKTVKTRPGCCCYYPVWLLSAGLFSWGTAYESYELNRLVCHIYLCCYYIFAADNWVIIISYQVNNIQ